MQISFVMLIFLLFTDQILFFGGGAKVSERGKLLEGAPSCPPCGRKLVLLRNIKNNGDW